MEGGLPGLRLNEQAKLPQLLDEHDHGTIVLTSATAPALRKHVVLETEPNGIAFAKVARPPNTVGKGNDRLKPTPDRLERNAHPPREPVAGLKVLKVLATVQRHHREPASDARDRLVTKPLALTLRSVRRELGGGRFTLSDNTRP